MLETIVENSPVSLVLIDNHGRVAYANGAARQLIGDGRTLEGEDFRRLLERLPSAMRLRSDQVRMASLRWTWRIGRDFAAPKERLSSCRGSHTISMS